MALLDFKKYLWNIQAQYVEMKNDLADYNEAFEKGYITEDNLIETKEYIGRLKENYDRLLYVAYLLEIPNKKTKKTKYLKNKSAQELNNYFNSIGASQQKVYDENESLLNALRKELKNLTKADK